MDIIIIFIFIIIIMIIIITNFIIITVINFFYYYSKWFETKRNTWACVRIICVRVLLQKRTNDVSGDWCFDILIIVSVIWLFRKIFLQKIRQLDQKLTLSLSLSLLLSLSL